MKTLGNSKCPENQVLTRASNEGHQFGAEESFRRVPMVKLGRVFQECTRQFAVIELFSTRIISSLISSNLIWGQKATYLNCKDVVIAERNVASQFNIIF